MGIQAKNNVRRNKNNYIHIKNNLEFLDYHHIQAVLECIQAECTVYTS